LKYTSYLPAYEDGTESVPKRRCIKFRRRGITQKKGYEFNLVMQIYLQTFVLQKCEQLFTCECRYLPHMTNAQPKVYIISSNRVIPPPPPPLFLNTTLFFFFFLPCNSPPPPQCLFKTRSFVLNLHKRSSPSYTSTINYFQKRPQMFVQIRYRAPMPTPLCNAKYFLFCGKHLIRSNGQHITVYCLTKIMTQTKCVATYIISQHARFYIPTHYVPKSKGNK